MPDIANAESVTSRRKYFQFYSKAYDSRWKHALVADIFVNWWEQVIVTIVNISFAIFCYKQLVFV